MKQKILSILEANKGTILTASALYKLADCCNSKRARSIAKKMGAKVVKQDNTPPEPTTYLIRL